ncbi:L-threonylcarbamoyladenylate synthase [Salinimicrobium sp. TH3]|uniref:L-threonylcarbamoyladenylate synthase n=1 Tax=Salinimicrobium sp. TH3 TaxID=2997342 RepID=UPI00227434D6|nr:L-threonylcarbamoyladenylate synthase [Salinimicrobium sp. TH3]MCY2688452.1 L-threonylcarbamoyladenylate synthase [Salinimicrobium sp. TH3]
MSEIIDTAISELKDGGIIAIPTETVYGLGGNALSEAAVKKIFDLKNRPLHNPLIVHIASVDELEKLAKNIPDVAYRLAHTFWPGPLTLILKKKEIIPSIVTAGLDTVAVRIPDHWLTLELLKKLPFPLAAPSANPFGSISPTKPDHVLKYFKNQLNLIIDGGECQRGIESTIVGFDKSQNPIIFRQGAITAEEIEKITGKLHFCTHEDQRPKAPGMLSKHYSPKTKSCLTNNLKTTLQFFEGKKIGALLFQNPLGDLPLDHQEILSESGDLKVAAKNVYAAMHRLDQKNLDIIIFEQLPDKGLGITINDKLRRAAKD